MKLDINQENIINTNENILVLASAGCGKTFTLVNKVKKLLSKYNDEDILILSFTNETVNDLKNRLPSLKNIYTFHKLAINILLENKITYTNCSEYYLSYIIDEYFISIINIQDKQKIMLYFADFNYNKLIISKKFKSFKNTIYTFIKLYQCNNITNITKLYSLKDKFLLSIIFKIYYTYINEKKSQNLYDFDDLIYEASIISKNTKFNYKYIFVDEFQDSSDIRFNLIYNIYKNSNSIINLFGDDYQSIYAFSGCNLSIMLNIKDKIPNIKTFFLNANYRSDNKLISCATKFINKNPKQIKKHIYSNKNVDSSINFISENKLNDLLKAFSNQINETLILCRYKHNITSGIRKYNIKTMTIHQSKGLEAKYIIIIGLTNDLYGFPSKIKNHYIIDKLIYKDEIKYAEERRLFYVALTRAKEKVFIIVPKNKSIFINELKKISK